MGKQIKVFATKSEDLSSIPRNYMEERTDAHKLSSNITHTHTHIF